MLESIITSKTRLNLLIKFFVNIANNGYLNSFKNHFFFLIKDLIRIFFNVIIFNKEKYVKHLYRFSGLYNSMIGNKSKFRIE